jgi:hypothetical protein
MGTRLKGWTILGTIPGTCKMFSLLQYVQIFCAAHQAFCSIGTPPSSNTKVRNEWSYTCPLAICPFFYRHNVFVFLSRLRISANTAVFTLYEMLHTFVLLERLSWRCYSYVTRCHSGRDGAEGTWCYAELRKYGFAYMHYRRKTSDMYDVCETGIVLTV